MSGPAHGGGDPAGDLLRERFAGKRRATRVHLVLEASVQGASGAIAGTLLDLSMEGALVEVDGSSLAGCGEGAGAAACLEEVEREFGRGLLLRFQTEAGRPPVEVEAEVVRMAFEGDGTGRLRLGCRFRGTVAPDVLALLGVDARDEGPGRRWAPRPGAAPFVLVFGAEGAAAGPRCAARVVSVSERRLVARVEGSPDARATSSALHRGAISIVLVSAGRRLWETPADLLSVRTDGTTALELEVVLPEPPPRRALRPFRAVDRDL